MIFMLVYVKNLKNEPINPVRPAEARILLKKGHAVIDS
jgi:transketolase N-terminal domain/subunit